MNGPLDEWEERWRERWQEDLVSGIFPEPEKDQPQQTGKREVPPSPEDLEIHFGGF
jgi:hypothetical protein